MLHTRRALRIPCFGVVEGGSEERSRLASGLIPSRAGLEVHVLAQVLQPRLENVVPNQCFIGAPSVLLLSLACYRRRLASRATMHFVSERASTRIKKNVVRKKNSAHGEARSRAPVGGW